LIEVLGSVEEWASRRRVVVVVVAKRFLFAAGLFCLQQGSMEFHGTSTSGDRPEVSTRLCLGGESPDPGVEKFPEVLELGFSKHVQGPTWRTHHTATAYPERKRDECEDALPVGEVIVI